ncbi:uncharacterized protein SETTUDRAFT_33548 [Exserohilum turcica Et28A]|uniref:N-acetyltransferase domain-containing protein n=1 Tax=Exserohilum turcicum (strain 28A) TaxID=671987 RepID=R0K4H7_EXST2|nr:uncharacterized protein SETTUDRAFT_33548 [Exserohilum turcica Et28A]EOA83237.1 hypothetical protein SETTUDRAFT_33548 [Exserohilum turcica Et28A]
MASEITSTTTDKAATWQPLSTHDVPAVMHMANTMHASLPERAAVFEERIALFPRGCLGLFDASNRLCGYLISHPIRRGQAPALDSLLGEIPGDADQYYVHDLAIAAGFRGTGFAQRGVSGVLEGVASGYATSGLISVYGTGAFWARFGFGEVEEKDEEGGFADKIRGYGEDAVYLERKNG